MKKNVARSLIAGLALLALSMPGAVNAGFLNVTDSAYTSIIRYVDDGSGNYTSEAVPPVTGVGSVDTGFLWDTGGPHNSVIIAAAQAGTGATSGSLLRAYAEFADRTGTTAADSMSNASATSSHADYIYLNSLIHPDAIRMTFAVDGSFVYQPDTGFAPGHEYANFSVSFTGYQAQYSGPGTASFDLRIRGSEYNSPTSSWASGPWDSFQASNLAMVGGRWSIGFRGTYSLDVPVNSDGVAIFSAVLFAFAGGSNGTGFADLGHTAALTAITDLNGNSINDLSFDSGLIFEGSPPTNLVPEPSSFCMTATAVVLGCLYRFRRARCGSRDCRNRVGMALTRSIL